MPEPDDQEQDRHAQPRTAAPVRSRAAEPLHRRLLAAADDAAPQAVELETGDGGITNGADIVVRVAVRPATSIGRPQTAAKKQGGTTTIAIEGRHDPCICPRVVPVAESMLAIVLMDAWLRQRALRGRER